MKFLQWCRLGAFFQASIFAIASSKSDIRDSIAEVCMQLQPHNYASEFILAPEAAALVPVPLRSFHKYVKEGLFPSYKIGRHRLFKRCEIIAAVERQRTGSISETLS